ncbi:polynucleotide kinase-phosphatase [Allokutzneria sp. NRRL B-24872]|uniref:polynucleotide kinase-phosphatase n=1 Tax=Allokutzneria sp. NRRL B-24872 TaxID=1137961 RepID=UPI000A37B46D|nr:polynucleotide kinase-phosphatase [Allokutzneria sp. NRRL B-24872]
MSTLDVPELCLVVLVGASGSGKSTFAREHFGRFEVVSSDFCRGLVADDENDQAASADAFDVLNFIVGKRLTAGRLTVIDATNVQPESRKKLVELARAHDVLPVAIVLDLPEKVCHDRNASRPDRDFGEHVVRRQRAQLRRSLRFLQKEGFRKVHVLRSEEEVAGAEIVRERLLNDFKHETGPFDVIGDIHGCRAELETLLVSLGYTITRDSAGRAVDAAHPSRRAVFVGDLVDRGPDSPGVLRLVMGMVGAGHAFAVPGNHENKLVRALQGRNVQVTHGLAETLEQLAGESEEFRKEVQEFCYGLVSHLVLDGGKLVVAHAGLKESYHGRASGRVRSFALYGDSTGETDEFGLPVRYPWAVDYRGKAMVLYGHVPTPEVEWINNTMCLDTGCVFGGKLTALRYPEKEVVSVPAEKVWYEPTKPFPASTGSMLDPASGSSVDVAPARRDPDALDVTDVLGKRVVETAHHGRISVSEESAAGALEVMSRFAMEPRWLLYLPPTMAPSATTALPGLLEHPTEAFDGYRADGIAQVICEEKHMGSRAVAVVCRDETVAVSRFGASNGATGAIYTRTGRPFFDGDLTERLLARLRSAVTTAGLWEELETGWLMLDCELLPWSAKAEDLLRNQYAAVGAAARTALPVAVSTLESAVARGVDVASLLARTTSRASNAIAFTESYRRYCWPTSGLDGISLAPFQVLATEGATYHGRDHSWHLAVADRLVEADPELVRRTGRLLVDTTDPESTAAGIAWWESLTAEGGEGMVVKPHANLTRAQRGLAQPGVKVRGREYLRIIYGPDYTEEVNLSRLRERRLGHKRSMALREYALGLESLDRAVRGEPLWRVHEPVFATLALESEPVDPRL